jgi:SAM-dependent methyltransferase
MSHVATMFARVLRRAAALRRGNLRDSLAAAKHYVATDEVSGQLQFALLQREGCLPSSRVLEVGCGCLNAGVPLIEYLNPGHYVGIDPNEWLLEAAMRRQRVRRLVASKRPIFLSRSDFDAGELGLTFDYVLSHSVLSHCAHWQLEQFVSNLARALRPGGRILASIRLAEGNTYGSPGTPDKEDSMDGEWQYPGVSWFKFATVKETAERHGLTAVLKPEYTELYISQRPKEMHDWIVFS